MASKLVNVTGKLNWAKVYQPDDKFGPARWSVNVEVSKEIGDKLKELCASQEPKFSIKFLKKTDNGYEIKAKRAAIKADGSTNTPPVVTDANGKPFDRAIGNGSVAKVTLYIFTWENKFGKGWSSDFNSIQVLEHVPYEANEVLDLSEDLPKKPSADLPFDDDIPFEL